MSEETTPDQGKNHLNGLEGTVLGTHTRLGAVTVPTRQTRENFKFIGRVHRKVLSQW